MAFTKMAFSHKKQSELEREIQNLKEENSFLKSELAKIESIKTSSKSDIIVKSDDLDEMLC